MKESTPWPEDYGRPALRRTLAGIETRPHFPGQLRVKITWRYSGVVHYGDAMCNGRLVPMFKTMSRDEPRPWETMTEEQLENFRRVWGA